MLPNEQAFRNALTANPADDVCRLAYSDWLEERGDIGKATYLRLIVRAVEQITNGEELGPTREGLWPLISTLEEDWLNAVGRRFDVRLEGYDPIEKVGVCSLLRQLYDKGLSDSQKQSENLPNDLTRGCRLEVALAIRSRFVSISRVRLIVVSSARSRRYRLTPSLNELCRLIVELDPHADDFEDEEAQLRFGNFLEHLPAFQQFIHAIDPNAKVEPQNDSYSLCATFPRLAPRWVLDWVFEADFVRIREYDRPNEYTLKIEIRPDFSEAGKAT
jgi:uncharacterized protein (TIGR02996 family)